ncbi:hypothetical protein Tco_0379355 [Tanacetum coccineum]
MKSYVLSLLNKLLCLQIDDDAMEEIDIQLASSYDKLQEYRKSENKLGHFARECKFAKYQANRANGSKEKRIVPIEDLNSKALVAKDSQGEIEWTMELHDDPDHVVLRQDGHCGCFDWRKEDNNCNQLLLGKSRRGKLKDNAIIDSGCSGMLIGKGQTLRCQGSTKGEFKFVDENRVLLRGSRKNDVFSMNIKSIFPSGGVTCFVQKKHMKLKLFLLAQKIGGMLTSRHINKFVKNNLVRNPGERVLYCKVSSAINGVTEEKNRSLIEEARNLAAVTLPIQFEAEAVLYRLLVPLTIEDQDLQKEFENLMLQEISAHTHMENQGIASEIEKAKRLMKLIVSIKKQKQAASLLYPHQALLSFIVSKNRNKSQRSADHACLPGFLSQEEHKEDNTNIADESWRLKAMDKEELIQFKATECMGGIILEEGVDYDEVFAPVARLKHQIFLAFAFFYGILRLSNGCQKRGAIDKTLFIKREGNGYLVIKSMVDDIFFGSYLDIQWLRNLMSYANKVLLGFSYVKDKYVKDILITKFGLQNQTHAALHLLEAHEALGKDEEGDRCFERILEKILSAGMSIFEGGLVILGVQRNKQLIVYHLLMQICRAAILFVDRYLQLILAGLPLTKDLTGSRLYSLVIWDTLRDIGYEGSLTLLSFSKPLLSPQWKYLVHTLLHCLSSKSSSWDQFGDKYWHLALVGLAYKSEFNFSKLIFDGMLRNLKDSKPFLMYPRFIQLFLNKQLEGSTKPQTFLPTVVLPPKVFTFMSKCILSVLRERGSHTSYTPLMLEVATALSGLNISLHMKT